MHQMHPSLTHYGRLAFISKYPFGRMATSAELHRTARNSASALKKPFFAQIARVGGRGGGF